MKRVPGIEPTTVDNVAGCLYRKGRKKLTGAKTKQRIGAMLKVRDRAKRRR